MHLPGSHRGQRSCAYLISFNEYALYVASSLIYNRGDSSEVRESEEGWKNCEMVPRAVHKWCKVFQPLDWVQPCHFFSGLLPDFRGHAGYANVLVCVKLKFFFYHWHSSLGRETAKMIEVENIPGDKNDGLRVLSTPGCVSVSHSQSLQTSLYSPC